MFGQLPTTPLTKYNSQPLPPVALADLTHFVAPKSDWDTTTAQTMCHSSQYHHPHCRYCHATVAVMCSECETTVVQLYMFYCKDLRPEDGM